MKDKISNIGQLKIGAILSYILIASNTLYGLIITPYVLSALGTIEYGVYSTIASFASSLLIMDLGIGTTVQRYTAKYRAENDKASIGNFAAIGLLEAAVMVVIVCVVAFVIYNLMDYLYGKTFSDNELLLAKCIFVIFIMNICITFFEHIFYGLITGYNRFVFANSVKLSILLLRSALIFVILKFFPSAISLVSISLGLSILIMIVFIYYVVVVMQIKIKLRQWNNALFTESLTYTALMFIQTIAAQANGNIDNIVIGAIIGPAAVTVYTFGIQFFNMYEMLATSLSNVMLPTVSMKIAQGANDDDMQRLVTMVGRVQFMLLGTALAGFLCLGDEFIYLWLGEGFDDVYPLALILMFPVTFTLIQNVCLSILRARNMMQFRTLSLITTAIINAAITIIGTKLFGYYAAALGTAISILLGSIIMMNVYYHYRIGFRVLKFYRDVFNRLLFCILIPAMTIYLLKPYIYGGWLAFLIKASIFLMIWGGLLMFYGMNRDEKAMILRWRFVKA